MKVAEQIVNESAVAHATPGGRDLLLPLVSGQVTGGAHSFGGVVVGELIAIVDEGSTPLVVFPGQQQSAAVRARAVLDLHGTHIGKPVVLVFEDGDPARPIVLGVLRHAAVSTLQPSPGLVEVDADGERIVVSATEQLVLRCGKASITLTKAGKVLLQGTYVSNRSSGVLRLKGGSVQIN